MRQASLSPGRWSFRDATTGGAWLEAVVPGCVHQDLLRHGLIEDPFWGSNELGLQWIEERTWEYRTTFLVAENLRAEQHLELVADGLDTVARIQLNGRLLGRTDNMFCSHRWAIGRHLVRGENELVVRFDSAMDYIRQHRRQHQPKEFNDPVGRCTVLRKQQSQFGWDWAPRLVTAGIWRDIRLEAWTGNRLESVRVVQKFATDGSVNLSLTPELAHPDARASCRWRLLLGSVLVAEGIGRDIRVDQPQLWWPNGHGAQPLYTLHVEVLDAAGRSAGRWMHRLGLRSIVLDRSADPAGGENFRFVVNGRPIFMKGANWIPAHSFVAGLGREDYARDLRHAAAAHMNMLRVWGGGIYESDHFYSLCDELGLLVWQDFMFACTLYPGDAAFRASIRLEARHQIRRLRHHACLALWCGNNEIEQLNAPALQAPRLRRAYDALFLRDLPRAVAENDGITAYWPSSAHRPDEDNSHAGGERNGDTHFWDVWHSRHPVKEYEQWCFRFLSEFGMQSYCSPETQKLFCPPHDDNVFGPAMENHQKNRAGNQIILDYISRRYRFPRSQEDLIYLSQLNQAYCMQTGVEHNRRQMPHCMGTLYWQLNDCWPVASWSSLEFTGRWKALHYHARRFYAPALACAHVPGDEIAGIGNYRQSTVGEVRLFTVYDAPAPATGTLCWELFHLPDSRVLLRGHKRVRLKPGESRCQRTLRLEVLLARHGRDNVVLRVALELDGRCVSQDGVLLSSPRFLALQPARTRTAIRLNSPRLARLTFNSNVYQHRFSFDLPGFAGVASDNYFDLFPGQPRTVTVELTQAATVARLRRALVHRSLIETYY